MDKNQLAAEECLFIDDNAINLEYPRKIGWSTILYHTFEQVQKDLKNYL